MRAALKQVVAFADLAIQGLGFASPVLGSIGTPLTVDQTELAGKTTPTDSYAAAIAVIVSLMFVTVLLAAGMLAIERSENAYSRLVRGLVSPERLLSEKVVLAAGCAAAVTLLMAILVSLFVHLDWARFPLWIVALAFGGLAFGALGTRSARSRARSAPRRCSRSCSRCRSRSSRSCRRARCQGR